MNLSISALLSIGYNMLSGSTGTTASGSSSGSVWSTILLMVLLFVIMYFVMIRPQQKKQKEDQAMRDAIQIGDEITTIGGIVGRVVTVKEDTLVIETGSDKNKMKITRWAIQTNNTNEERIQAQREAQAAAKAAEKEAKTSGKKGGKKVERTRKTQQISEDTVKSGDSASSQDSAESK